MKSYKIKVYPLATEVALSNLSHQKAELLIPVPFTGAATAELYYP